MKVTPGPPVRTVVDSPLLDRQLAPMKSGGPPKGDLPIAFLQPEWNRSFSAKTQVVCLTRRTASKQRRKHGNLRPEAEPFACFLSQIKCLNCRSVRLWREMVV